MPHNGSMLPRVLLIAMALSAGFFLQISQKLPGSDVALAQSLWIRQSPIPTYRNLYGVAFATSTHGFVIGPYQFLAETMDGGATWRIRSDGLTAEPYYDIQFFDAMNGWIVGNGSTVGGNHLRTTDGGVTWNPRPSDLMGSWQQVDFVSLLSASRG